MLLRLYSCVSLDVPTGTVLGLLGPNGAGKTTAVRILTTTLLPDSGRGSIAGFDVVAEPQAVLRSIGLAGQYAAVDENLTGKENLTLVGRLNHLNVVHAYDAGAVGRVAVLARLPLAADVEDLDLDADDRSTLHGDEIGGRVANRPRLFAPQDRAQQDQGEDIIHDGGAKDDSRFTPAGRTDVAKPIEARSAAT